MSSVPSPPPDGRLKQCARCRQWLPLSDYGRDRSRKDGHAHSCQRCEHERGAQQRKKFHQRRLANARALRKRRVEQGRCGSCGRLNDRPGLYHCAACARAANLIRNPHVAAAGPCVLCGFPYSDVHHKDGNHSNNDPVNLIALCPNHHRLVHRGLLPI